MKLFRVFGARTAPFDFNEAKCVQAPPGLAAQALMIGQTCAGPRGGPQVETRAKLAAGGFEGNRIRSKSPAIGHPG